MVRLGFGYQLFDPMVPNSRELRFFAFEVPDMTLEEFEELDQGQDHPDRDEWADGLDEAIDVATTDCCDIWGSSKTPPDTLLWCDYNVKTTDDNLIKGCEILRFFFMRKGMAASAISEYREDW